MSLTLVIGASSKPNRYSNLVINKLLENKKDIVAIGAKEGEVRGVKIVTEQFPFENVDTITLYINPKLQPGYYDYILSLNPKRVIFNPGTENPEFYKILKENNIQFEIACTLVLLSTNQY